jgi:hypothetical protein
VPRVRGPQVLGAIRLTPICDVCVRVEYDPERRFVDAPSTFAIDREALGEAEVERGDGELVLDTGRIRLRCRDDGRAPHADNLTAEIRDGDWAGRWHPGMRDEQNLGGALPTLDGVLGPTVTEPGLLSRAGWQVVDDTRRPLIAGGWWRPRPAGTQDFYLFGYGRDFRAALRALATVAGPVPLPRRYALGSWYSRYWPYTSAEFRAIVEEYRRHGYPLDVLVLDMDWHRAGWTGWSWNRELLPDAEALLAWLHERGLAVTLNVHPADGVGPHEDAYPDFMRALGKDPATGETVPFNPWDRPTMTALLETVHRPLEAAGVDFWWLDWQQVIADLEPICAENILLWMNRAYFEHGKREGRRGLSFGRWGGWGDHRHPIHFSGDVHTGWDALAFTVAFTVSSGNAGLFFWSHDIGGHLGPRDDECYARWVQFGALSAGLRLHSMRAAALDRRPWTYGPPAQRSARRAVGLRAQLFPYIYSSAAESCRATVPLLRPMYLDHAHEEVAYQVPHQYLLGPSLLVAPVVAPGIGEAKVAEQAVWFPPGAPWYHLLTGEAFAGGQTRLVLSDLDELPVFARGGAVIPLQSPGEHMAGPLPREIVLRVYPGADGASERADLYEDDGVSDLSIVRDYATTPFCYERRGDRVRVCIGPTRVEGGGFAGMPLARTYRLELAGTRPAREARLNGRPVALEYEEATATNRLTIGPADLGSGAVLEGELPPADPLVFATRAQARRLIGARPAGCHDPGEPARADLLAEGAGAAVSLGASTAEPTRAVFLFQEREADGPDEITYRIVDEWGDGGGDQLVRQEGVARARPGAPARLTDAGTPPLDAEARELDKRRYLEAELPGSGSRRLRRLIAEARGVPMRRWVVAGSNRVAQADPGGVVRLETPEVVRLTTRFYSAGPQDVFFTVSTDGAVMAWLDDEPLALQPGRSVRLARTFVAATHAPHYNRRLWLRVSPEPGKGAVAVAVRLKGPRVIVEQDPDAAPPWPFAA